jgi:hypothetical protein
MHILAGIALVVLVGLFFLFKWLLTAVGVIKPNALVPSGYTIGHKGKYVLGRDSKEAERFIDAHSRMIKIRIYDNEELWRVLDYKPAIDDTYEFTVQRVD